MVRPLKKDSIVYTYCFTAWFSFNKRVLIAFHINTYRGLIITEFHNMSILYLIQAFQCCSWFWLSSSLPPSLPSFPLFIHFCYYKQCWNDHPILQTPAWELPFVHCCLWVKSHTDFHQSVVWVFLETGSAASPTGDSVGSILVDEYLIRLTLPRFTTREQPRLVEHWAKLSCIQLFFPSLSLCFGHLVLVSSSSLLFIYRVQHPS